MTEEEIEKLLDKIRPQINKDEVNFIIKNALKESKKKFKEWNNKGKKL